MWARAEKRRVFAGAALIVTSGLVGCGSGMGALAGQVQTQTQVPQAVALAEKAAIATRAVDAEVLENIAGGDRSRLWIRPSISFGCRSRVGYRHGVELLAEAAGSSDLRC